MLVLSDQECERSPSARSTRSAVECSPSTGQMCPATMMCEPLPEQGSLPMELPSMSSPAASHVRTSPSLANALVSKVRDLVSGESTGASLAKFDPDTFSWRTSQACLVSGWEPFSETFPRSGMMRSGTVSQLRPSAPLTAETAFGSWPTPRAHDAGADFAKLDRSKTGLSLATAVRLWPTPANRDYRYPNAKPYSERGGGKKGEQLPNVVGGPVNPTWVEWLMGFAAGWTDCARSEMQSFRKSRKPSAAR